MLRANIYKPLTVSAACFTTIVSRRGQRAGFRLTAASLMTAAAIGGAGCAGHAGGAGARQPTIPRPSSSGQFPGEQGRVAAVIADYAKAMRDGGVTRLCDELLVLGPAYGHTGAERRRRCAVTSGDLAQEVRTLQHKPFDLTVLRVQVKGKPGHGKGRGARAWPVPPGTVLPSEEIEPMAGLCARPRAWICRDRANFRPRLPRTRRDSRARDALVPRSERPIVCDDAPANERTKSAAVRIPLPRRSRLRSERTSVRVPKRRYETAAALVDRWRAESLLRKPDRHVHRCLRTSRVRTTTIAPPTQADQLGLAAANSR